MAELFVLVLIAHLVGDWILQTDEQAANKENSWYAMHQHCVSYHLFMYIILVWFMPIVPLLILLAISYVTHAFIDRRWPVRLLMAKTGSPGFSQTLWGVITVDQILHISILFVALMVLM